MYMKKETSAKKGKLWLIIAIAVVAVLAVAGVILALTLGGGNQADVPEVIESKLYWNVDRATMVNEETMLSLREPAADGLYYIRFAVDGEQVELPCADKKLVNKIDFNQVMGLKFDADGIIIDLYSAKDVATMIVENAYVQNVAGNTVTTNSSMTLNGMEVDVDMSNANVYIVEDPRPEVPGRDFTVGAKDEVQLMDTIIAFGDDETSAHTVFITNRLYDSKVYWRYSAAEFDSANKVSTRKLADDGYWYIDFMCEGEIVTVRTADQACINAMDGYGVVACACGLVFDKNGDVVDVFNAGLAVKGSVAANNYDVTAIDGNMVTLTRKLSGSEQGRTYMLNVTEDLVIRNVTTTADKFGEETELQLGDRMYVLADASGNPVQAYITCRLVDSPMYYNVSVSYNSTTKETNRTPDENGWYTITLAVNGKQKEFRCKDKDLMTQIDAYGNRMFGLKLKGDRIVKVYNPECVTGAYSFAANNWVTSVAGEIVGTTKSDGTAVNGIMAENCEVYDVSGCSEFMGAKATLREGDRIVAYNTPDATMRYIYITSRKVDGVSLYWNFEKKYNASTGLTTRTPDEDGYYVFKMAKCGSAGEKLLKTKDIEIASKIDKTGVYALCLKTKGDIIQKVYPATAINAGYSRIYGIYTTQQNDDTHWGAIFYTSGATANIDISLAKIYNVSGVYKKGAGENTKLQPNDRLMLLYGQSGKAEHIIVFERESGSSAYFKYDPNFNSTAKTTEPDENGYYNYTVTVGGKVKNVKTKDKDVAAYVDQRTLAFGLKLDGDIIKAAYSAASTKEIAASGISYYDVTKIKGNKITLERTTPGSSNTGDVKEIDISKAKVYNVSSYAGDAWGKTAKLGIGDRVQTYINEKNETTLVYIIWENTREAGHKSYCEHCGKEVYWHPYYGTIDFITDKHYYLPADFQTYYSKGWGIQGRETGWDWVLDLNGFTYEATGSYAFAVRGNSTLTIVDTSKAQTGRVTGVGVQIKDAEGNKSKYQSSVPGIFSVLDNGTLNLCGGTYTRTVNREITNLRRAGVAIVEKTGTLNIYDGAKLVDNTMDVPLDLTVSEPRVETRRAPQGGAIYNNGGTVNIYGGLIANNGKIHEDYKEFENTAVGNGGNIFQASGELNIYGGKITGGWCVGNGGNIYVTSGKLNIAGGEISGGTSINGANNIIVAANNNAEVNITGGKITGDVTILAGNTLKVSGKPQITLGEKQGLFLAEGVKAQVGTMKSGAKIVISSTGIFTTDFKSADAAKAAKAYFASADKDIPISVVGKALACGTAKCLNGHTNTDQCDAANCEAEMLFWQPWKDASSLPTSGNYYLTKDVTIDARVTTSSNVYLDLNGKNITRVIKADAADYGVYSTTAADLYITDLSGGTVGTVSTVFDTGVTTCAGTGFLAYVGAGRTLTIDKGNFDFSAITTTNNAGTGCAPIIADGKVVINGGTFFGISAPNGYGGIAFGRSGAELTVNGGTFYGGKIYQGGMFAATGRIIINDGIFNGNNSATNVVIDATYPRTEVTHGGLILARSNPNSYVEINGGTFIAPRTYTSGGMIYVEDGDSVVKINGGTYQLSTAGNGGFIRFRGKELTIQGVTLTGSTATTGDVIAFNSKGTMTIGKDAVIGGGIQMIPTGTSAKLVLQDNVQINKGTNYAIKLGGAKLDINGLNDQAKVYINHSDVGVAFAEAKDEATAKKLVDNKIIVSADANYIVTNDGSKLTVIVNDGYMDWESGDSLPTSGKYRLTKNVTIDARVTIAGNVYLDLNGFTVTRVIKADAADYGVYNASAGDLYITDSSDAATGKVTTVFDEGVTTCAGTGFLAYVAGGRTLTIDKGTFDFRTITTTSNAGAGCGPIIADGNVVINGGTFYGISASAGFGGIVFARSSAELTVNGGTFYGNKMYQGGMFAATGRIIINGGTFNGNNSASNTIIDSAYPRTEVTHGGIILARSNANSYVEINGGTFIAPRTYTSGGMIYVEAGDSVVKINGGTYQLSQAGNGGFIRFRGKTLDIKGVTLTGATATTGDIIAFNSTGTLTIGKDAVIDGGIQMVSAGKIVLKDNAKVNAGTNYGIKLIDGVTMDISGLNDQAKIHVNYTDTTKAFAVAADEATAKKLVDDKIIVSADPNYRVVNDGADLKVKVQIQWNEWNAAAAATAFGGAEADNLHLTKLPTTGDWKLIADVTIDARVAMTGNVNLNLNGFTATRVIKSGAADYGFYTTNSKGNLYITDEIQLSDPAKSVGTMKTVFDTGVTTSSGTGFLCFVNSGYSVTIDEGIYDFSGVKTTSAASTGCGPIVADGNVIINGGTFYGTNAASGYGGMISGRTNNTTTINGGTFIGGSAAYGGVVYTAGKVIINNGVLIGGSGTRGGLISAKNIEINSGVLDGNNNGSNQKVDANYPVGKAGAHGGLIHATGTVSITGGTFQNGYASGTSSAGGILYAEKTSTVTISGGTFRNGKATKQGGIMRCDGTLTITGASISGGTAGDMGDNVAFCATDKTMIIGANAVIDGGIATRTNETGTKIVLVGNAKINASDAAKYSLRLANTTVHIGAATNAAAATVGTTITDYVATYDQAGNVTDVQAQ